MQQAELLWKQHLPQAVRVAFTAKLLPWPQPAAVALNCVSIYALSGFILYITGKMCPKVTASLLYTPVAYEKDSQESPTFR